MKELILRKLTADEVKFRFFREEEDTDPRSCFDDPENQEGLAWILDEIKKGNEWAWFCAKITASWNGFKGESYLGACSDQSKEDFEKNNSVYLKQMKEEALKDLNKSIDIEFQALKELIT